MIVLSILIPTIPERSELFTKLFNELHRQYEYCQTFHPILGEIEILFDDRGRFLETGISIGEKRQDLIYRASGKYLCFLDDDENISPEYVEMLLRLCSFNQDVCTFRAIAKLQNYWTLIDMSLDNVINEEATPENIVRRPPWHTCPVRSEFAKAHEFKFINDAEDFEWMQRVLTMCKTETHTERILFQYNHNEHSESSKITKHEIQSIK